MHSTTGLEHLLFCLNASKEKKNLNFNKATAVGRCSIILQ
jgi:hypothetical protein